MLKIQSQNAKIASQNRKKIFACGGQNPRFAREIIAKLLSFENSNADFSRSPENTLKIETELNIAFT